jgi:hypothetical protein
MAGPGQLMVIISFSSGSASNVLYSWGLKPFNFRQSSFLGSLGQEKKRVSSPPQKKKTLLIFTYLFIYFAVLGFELRAYNLSHSTSPFL